MKTVKISEMSFATLFKISFLTGCIFWIALGLLILLLTLIAPSAVTINNETATGVGDGFKALALCVIIGGLLNAVVAAAGAGGLRLISKKFSLGTIEIQDEI